MNHNYTGRITMLITVFYFYWPFQDGTSFLDHLCYLWLVFVMLSRLFIAALWSRVGEKAELLAPICDVYSDFVTFSFWILGQVWYLIVSIPDPCCVSYFYYNVWILFLNWLGKRNFVKSVLKLNIKSW